MKKLFFALILSIVSITVFAAWNKVAAPIDKNLLCISFASRSVAYIGSTDSTLLKTVDGGKTWSVIPTSGLLFSATAPDIIDLNFITPSVGYAVIGNNKKPTYTGTIYKTTDGGASWSISTDVNVACRKTFFFDEDNGVQVGSAFFSGKNVSRMVAGKWQEPVMLEAGPDSFLHAVDFYNKTTGITGGDNGFVYRTFDGGVSWDTVKTNAFMRINELLYVDEHTIVAATDEITSALIVSRDKGLNWEFDAASGSFYYPAMKAVVRSVKDSLIVAGASQTTGKGIIFVLGGTFPSIHEAPQNLNDLAMADDSVAYAIGDSGLILTNYILSTGIKDIAPKGLLIYPNPARSTLYIEALEENSVRIFDLTGKQVAAGQGFKRSHILNLGNITPGAYLVSLTSREGQNYSTAIEVR